MSDENTVSGNDLAFMAKRTSDGREYEHVSLKTVGRFVELEMDERMVFCTELGKGDTYVQRMRVDLSRLRGQIRRRGKAPRKIKMIVEQIVSYDDYDEVTLLKTMNASVALSEEMKAILKTLEAK